MPSSLPTGPDIVGSGIGGYMVYHAGAAIEPRLLAPSMREGLSAGYQQFNLVGFQPGMARHTDPNLNGWGLDYAPNGPFCVANTSTGLATFYGARGNTAAPPVDHPGGSR